MFGRFRQLRADAVGTIRSPCCNEAMTTHPGCVWDYPEDVATGYGEVRGLRLVLASLRDDDADDSPILDEMGDCTQCLRCMVRFLAGMAGSLAEALADTAGGDRVTAIRQVEKQTTDANDSWLEGRAAVCSQMR